MNQIDQTEPIADSAGKLILRVTIAGLMLFHGIAKLQNGVGSIEGMLESAGLPVAMAYGVYVGEVVVPVAMMLGFFTRIASLIFAFNMVMAIWLGHAADVFALNQFGGWAIELQLLYLLGAISIFLLGSGRFAIRRGNGFWGS